MKGETCTLLFLWLLAVLFLPCGYCQDKTESQISEASHREGKDLSAVSWNRWENGASKAMDWTTLTNSQPQTVPYSIEEQQNRQQQQKSKKQAKGSARKTTSKSFDLGIDELRHLLLKYGKNIFDFVTGKSAMMGLRSIFPGGASSTSRQSMGSNVIDWLSRLIGVPDKTLGEFLREYQVHVLYDLVFTFFKWIFFLYAGLLIP